ncbi:MAG TPA: hypothetical protein PKD32_11435 [Saprospiraceae bacterium]|nr:hypothetical protein [Saprospiraceae bacterium]
MGKQTLMKISYYEDNYNLHEIYKEFFAQKRISFFDVDYYFVDDDPVKFSLQQNQIMSDVFLDAILKYKNKSVSFNLIFDDIITYHNLNIVEGIQITIGVGQPKMIEAMGIPDFTYYIKNLLPYFKKYEIQSIEFSYG